MSNATPERLQEAVSAVEYIARCLHEHGEYAPHFAGGVLEDLALIVEAVNSHASLLSRVAELESGIEGSMDAADPAGSSHRARSASEAEPALRCEASARGVRWQSNNL